METNKDKIVKYSYTTLVIKQIFNEHSNKSRNVLVAIMKFIITNILENDVSILNSLKLAIWKSQQIKRKNAKFSGSILISSYLQQVQKTSFSNTNSALFNACHRAMELKILLQNVMEKLREEKRGYECINKQ